MISDSITNASATSPPSARDSGKKKRTNRSAKLKQSKLGLRREQWLSQVAVITKRDKEEMNSNRKIGSEKHDQRDRPADRFDEEDNSGTHCHERFIESLSNSPNSILSGINSISNFSSSSCCGSGSGGSCSGNITEEEDADDECLDDWEAFADALAADDEKHEKVNLPESCEEHESIKESASPSDSISGSDVRDAMPDSPITTSGKHQSYYEAWRPGDKFRPQGLPNLEKQRSFPVMNSHFSSVAVPSSCPICCEDLDLTDSSFLPCPCGFRLCLFCHKTICDGDGRCPGCRKPYERNTNKVEVSLQGGGGGLTILARSSSMFCRS